MTSRTICVSFGHLHSFDAGLGEFAYRLGRGLVERREVLRQHGFDLAFHLQPHLVGKLGDDVAYVTYTRKQEVLSWSFEGCALWHSAFQHNITRPPREASRRMLTIHDLNYLYAKKGPGAWRDEFRTRLAVAHSNQLVCITHYVARDVQKKLAGSRAVAVVYNGATDLTKVEQCPVQELVGRKFMFHMSRMAPSKNVGSLLDLARAWPDRTFVFAGPEWGHSLALRNQTSGKVPNVKFMLGVNEGTKAWLLANCEVFLFPSLAEGFGLPPLEAMYFGTPVFLSDRTCLPEIGGDRVAYFKSFEAASMRQVVDRELPRLQAARELTKKRAASFSWGACVDAYISLYLKALT